MLALQHHRNRALRSELRSGIIAVPDRTIVCREVLRDRGKAGKIERLSDGGGDESLTLSTCVVFPNPRIQKAIGIQGV
jgi:hypothetical protein